MIASETGLTTRAFAVAILLACSVIWISAPFHFIGILLLDLADDTCAVITIPFRNSTRFIVIFLVLRNPWSLRPHLYASSQPLEFIAVIFVFALVMLSRVSMLVNSSYIQLHNMLPRHLLDSTFSLSRPSS
jgi:hypothetical protein